MILVLIILLMVVFGAATFVLFYASLYYQRRSKILNKIPLLDIVELEEPCQARITGRVVPIEETLRSPLSNVKCVYYRFIVEEEKNKTEVASNFARRRGAADEDAEVEWETILDEAQVVPFAVEDDSGKAEVAVKHLDAEVQSTDRHVTGSLKSCSSEQEQILTKRYPGKKLLFNKKMRYTEITIEKDDTIAVVGEVEVRKGRDPRFVALDDFPVQVSDKTDNKVLKDTIAKAKTNKIFAFVSSACTVAATVWLIVYLATPGDKSKSVADSSSSSSTTKSDTDKGGKGKANPMFEVRQNDNPVWNNPPKQEFFPKQDVFPKEENFPKVKDFPNPPKNDFDSLVEELKQNIDPPAIPAMQDTLRRIEKNILKNHPRRAELFKVLNEASKSLDVFVRNDCTKTAARYAGKEDIPELFAMLKEKRNVFAEDDIFKKLTELKDPASAEGLAEFLEDLGKRGKAVAALKAIGVPAEKAVQPYILEPNEIFTRFAAIELLGDIGTRASVESLQEVGKDPKYTQKTKAAIQKIMKRKQ